MAARMRRPVHDPLTDRETDVLDAVTDGLVNADGAGAPQAAVTDGPSRPVTGCGWG